MSRGERKLATVLATLCVTEIVSWGVLFYAFPVLVPAIARDTGWSPAALTGALSAALLVSALTGIVIGRVLDRRGPRQVMVAGSVVGVVAVVLIATARTLPWFFAAWVCAGLAMAATFYQPAFAALTRWYGTRRVRALTTLTLVAGFSSTVFAPLTALLAANWSWRTTYLVLAAVLAVITVPGHWSGLRRSWPPLVVDTEQSSKPRSEARSPAFVALVAAFSLTALGTYAVVVNLVALLAERGLSTGTAAIALGLGGAGQVAGRLGFATLVNRTGIRTRTAIVIVVLAATTTLLGSLTSAEALVVASVLAGMARGVFTLLQATAVADRWGTTGYGRLSGLLSAPLTIMSAVAPYTGAILAAITGSYSTAFVVLGVLTVAAAPVSFAAAPTSSKIRS
ncbi:MFS transporter [Amycolatopsis sp. NPDC049159]|uniref:MFS transporter n=1 Tax=Amycolatopsis sp. NPDC049159 TaxID=3157210 RepID=UPI0033E16D26